MSKPTYQEIYTLIQSGKIVRCKLIDSSVYYLTETTESDQQKFMARYLKCSSSSKISIFYNEVVEIVEIIDESEK